MIAETGISSLVSRVALLTSALMLGVIVEAIAVLGFRKRRVVVLLFSGAGKISRGAWAVEFYV